MLLLGASLGSAAAVDFALAHPEAVAGLVLVSPQCYTDGIGPMATLPRPLARLGVAVRRCCPTHPGPQALNLERTLLSQWADQATADFVPAARREHCCRCNTAFARSQVTSSLAGPISIIACAMSLMRMRCVFGVGQLLRTRGLRQLANRMAYHDKDRLATEDAMRVGRLHTHCPGARVAHSEHVHHCEEGMRCFHVAKRETVATSVRPDVPVRVGHAGRPGTDAPSTFDVTDHAVLHFLQGGRTPMWRSCAAAGTRCRRACGR